jgi:hypothetical protein
MSTSGGFSSSLKTAYPTYRIDGLSSPLTVVLPTERVARWWFYFCDVASQYAVLPEMLLAVTLVETALYPGGLLPDDLYPLSLQVVVRDDLWFEPVKPDERCFPMTLALAAMHLNLQCLQFADIALALVAYHTDTDMVDDTGDPILDTPAHQDYVRAVLSTFIWLCTARPWQHWYPTLDVDVPVRPLTGGGRDGT